jgi:hypothetical protein
MQKAVLLLKQEDKKLVEVAQSVGYVSDAAFSKAFKRVVGVMPREYRQGAVNRPAKQTHGWHALDMPSFFGGDSQVRVPHLLALFKGYASTTFMK